MTTRPLFPIFCIAACLVTGDAQGQPASAACPPAIAKAFAGLREGTRPTIQEIYLCDAEWAAYFQEFDKQKSSFRNSSTLQKRQADYYQVGVKMALINFMKYGGTPFRIYFIHEVADELKQRATTSGDPYDHFCSIFPSLITGDPDHAIRSFKFIQSHDPFLTELAAEWVNHVPPSAHRVKFTDAIK